MNRDSIHLTETGLQRCAGDSKLLGQHLNRQSLIQVPHQVFLNLAYGFNLTMCMYHTAEVRPAPLAVHGAGTNLQRLDDIVISDMSRLHIVQGRKQSFAPECCFSIQGSFQAREMDSPKSECIARRADHAAFASIRTRVP